jgi:hypothetical protein
LIKVRQTFERPRLPDVRAAVLQDLEQVHARLRPGASIAIAVGSRGIANLAQIVKATVDFVKECGAAPFIVPAMGSHGGGTAEGQAEVLASYGVTEANIGAPVRATMETVELTQEGSPNRVFMDRYAYESDGVILINRVKVHTDFHGRYESGLVKLSVIGLGKHRQALEIHKFGVYGLRSLIPPTAQQVLATGKILFGVAIVENAYDETMMVKALKAEAIMDEEPKLLDIARANMPSLPTERGEASRSVDVLIIDRMGKDISGAGLDPNIIGRNKIRGEPEPPSPQIKAIVVSDLTPASHGNAVGLGLADVITQQLFDNIDLSATYENAVTSTFLERGKIPVIGKDDATATAYALRSCGPIPPEELRVMRVRDTLHLGEVYVSSAILDEIKDRDDIEVIGEPVDVFDEEGMLRAF